MSDNNFYDISHGVLLALTPGARLLLDSGAEVSVLEIMPRSRQFSVNTNDGTHLRIGFDAVEQVLG